MSVSQRRSILSVLFAGMMGISAVPADAQSMSVADRVMWEEAMLALEEGDSAGALMLLDEVIGAAGPIPEVLYDAAWIAFEAREYLRAENYIQSVLETGDPEYRNSGQYDDAFRLAAQIQRALRPIRDSLVASTPLPFSDSLARTGFAREARDRIAGCEWRFDRGGLVAKHDDNATCMNGRAATAGPVRIDLTIEKRGGGSRSAAGVIFGHEDPSNYYFLRVHPRWDEMGGDISIVGIEEGREAFVVTSAVYDNRGRALRSWSEKGPWRLALEVRGRRIEWFLNGRHVGTEYLDREVRGDVLAGIAGADDGEFLFTNLSINRLPVSEGAAR